MITDSFKDLKLRLHTLQRAQKYILHKVYLFKQQQKGLVPNQTCLEFGALLVLGAFFGLLQIYGLHGWVSGASFHVQHELCVFQNWAYELNENGFSVWVWNNKLKDFF